MKTVHTRVLLAVVTMMAAACSPESAGMTSGHEPGTFVGRLGEDTLFMERIQREDGRVHGEVVARRPQTHRIEYVADVDDEGHVVRMEVRRFTPEENPEADGPVEWVVTVGGGRAVIEVEGPEGSQRHELEVEPGVIPSLARTPTEVFSLDQAARQATASGDSIHPVTFISPIRGRLLENAVTRLDPGTVAVDFFGNPFQASVAPDGELRSASGAATTMKVEIQPATQVADFAALAARWAADDVAGNGFGVPSPAAVAKAEVHGTTLEIDYSQPATRGRDIWGYLVPYGQIWRTGANAATQLIVDGDLVFGDHVLEAGTYTLWSTYRADGQELIVNEQTGQWGTAYDGDYDLFRVPMTRSAAPEHTERFVIEIEETPEGGLIHLVWDETRFSAPFQVR